MLCDRQDQEQGKPLIARARGPRRAVVAAAITTLLLCSQIAFGEFVEQDPSFRVICQITPAVLDVSKAAGPLTIRLEFIPRGTHSPLDPRTVETGLYISSVGGVRLPPPWAEAEGIDEAPGGRIVEDKRGLWQGVSGPNGIPELIVRFREPCDGDPATRNDGDAGDILAMLLDLPDGRSAEVCVAGRVAGSGFECCDRIEVRNRGLRDRPLGLFLPWSDEP